MSEKIKVFLPELNANQRKWLKRELLEITKTSRDKALPIAYIEQQIEELFTDTPLPK